MNEPQQNNVGTIAIGGVQSPYLEQYLGIWAMEETLFRAAFDRIEQMNLRLHVQEQQIARVPGGNGGSSPTVYSYTVNPNGTAVVDIRGTLMKGESSLSAGTSTTKMRRTVRALAADESVQRVMFVFDSPGGSVAGTSALGADIAALAAKKGVAGWGEDTSASASIWLQSQCPIISADPAAWLGSIGVYGVVADYSSQAARQGVKVHVVRSAKMKGTGTPGTEITADQLGDRQRVVDEMHAQFTSAVARGRRMDLAKVENLADGRMHPAEQAKKLGLIDHVEDLDSAIERLEHSGKAMSPTGPIQSPIMKPTNKPGQRAAGEQEVTAEAASGETAGGDTGSIAAAGGSDAVQTKETNMSQQQQGAAAPAATAAPTASEQTTQANAPKPATIAELKASCPGAPSDFLVEQAEKGVTADQAMRNFVGFQAAQIRSRDEQIAKATTAVAATATAAPPVAAAKKPVIAPLPTAAEGAAASGSVATGTDAKSQFEAGVREKMTAGKMSRADAVSIVSRENPELQAVMIADETKSHRERANARAKLGMG